MVVSFSTKLILVYIPVRSASGKLTSNLLTFLLNNHNSHVTVRLAGLRPRKVH